MQTTEGPGPDPTPLDVTGEAPRLPGATALLLIDLQAGFDDPSWGPRNNPQAEDNIARMLAAWRETGRPVIHVHHTSTVPDGAFRASSTGHVPKPGTAPRPGEAVISKTVNSAFIGTSLEGDLRRAGIVGLVIVGLTTNHCVSTTARMAGNLGFETIVVSDATAAFDRPALQGAMRPAEDVHLAALSDLQHEFARIADTRAILAALASGPPAPRPVTSA